MISTAENQQQTAITENSTQNPSADVQHYLYMFPLASGQPSTSVVDGQIPRRHIRSMSHGGGVPTITSTNSSNVSGQTNVGSGGSVSGRPSVLKGGRGHQRALSHGQVVQVQIVESGIKSGHSRGGSRTNFELPPGHRDVEDSTNSTARISLSKGHSRQASRSESIYTLRRSEVPTIWHRFFCFLLRKSPSADCDDRGYRTVVPNHIVPPKTPRKEHPNGARVNNRIRTTKYTLLSFLPRNLLEQFHRVANLYFIFIVLLNWFPAINAFGKEIAMIPVMLVLGVTAVKDLFEDRRRHASDKRINNSTCRIYKSEEERYRKVLWKDVRVGDLIHLSNNEIIPADILLLRSSDPNGICYLDTSHLDGEANLKLRQVPRGFVEKQDLFEPSRFRSIIEVESPSTKIYRFHGAIVHPTGKRIAVGTENLLLRECVLKNTDFIEGIIVYAGHETKAMLNNGGPRYKRSKLERQMNLDVIWCVLILIVLCLIGAIGCKLWLTPFKPPVPFLPNMGDPLWEGIFTFWTFIIILQIMIPLSLYVTLEFAKMWQVYHIHNDNEMIDYINNKKVECRALNITEELGQVQYIFSDKTGTLTENKMIFKNCCINGIDYHHKIVENVQTRNGIPPILPNTNLQNQLQPDLSTNQYHYERINEFLILLAICNTVVVSKHPHYDLMNASGVIEPIHNVFYEETSTAAAPTPQVSVIVNNKTTNPTATTTSSKDRYARLTESRSITPSPPLCNNEVITSSPVVPDTIQDVSTSSPNGGNNKKTKFLAIPSMLLSNFRRDDRKELSGSQTPTPTQTESKPIFEAESPDELALVDSAYLYDYKLIKRTPQLVTLATPSSGMLNFDILKILPFDSTRKMMSVIFRHPVNGVITLYTKGADTAIFSKLSTVQNSPDDEEILVKTQQRINTYAKQGLRVLLMAKRSISEHEYIKWNSQHSEYELLDDINKERKIQESYSKIENNLILLGATGIEDRLQEGVSDVLSSLTAAGIVTWVLTGDKPETAINIAYSAKLFTPNMDILKLMTRSKDAAENSILFYLSEIEKLLDGTSDTQIPQNHHRISVATATVTPKKAQRALVVDGKTLTYILDKRSNLTKPFLKLSTYCNSVLCCRSTPLQKAYIVKVVKEELKMRTLAIGDGANDVSMIQNADVGIGISGQEGMQAVMAADFSMSRFVYLKRFLLVHGHWSYDRLARMILYFFYKNAAFVFLIFWYQLYCGFSGTVMIDQMYLMLYNLLFTSLPPLAIGVHDRSAPEYLLMMEPYLYREGRLGLVYKPHSFWITMADALYQSIVIFFISQAAYADTDVGIWSFGTTISTCCMYVMVLHAAIEIHSWTIIHVGSIVASILLFYLYSLIYNSIQEGVFGLPTMYWVIQENMSTGIYWLVILLTCVTALLPRFLIRTLQTTYCPTDITRSLLDRRKSLSRGPTVPGIRI
ncbi:phospholipid-transporting ATPase VB isoform X2 [Chrysoperla carnea]|uniref:phospholipid-transporting ATPase VB isoform X2 n=1 Tax=Chrysoperla carnea TaxID=189513 RepID=UPI001D078973|nr:phospholipid-transporting ATPase VB isoform X2 [Chrysoperla carnea]